MHRFCSGIYPRNLVCIQSDKTRLNSLGNLFLWVQLQRSCVWSKRARVKTLRVVAKSNILIFVVRSLEVDFVADLGVFLWLDEFDAAIFAF